MSDSINSEPAHDGENNQGSTSERDAWIARQMLAEKQEKEREAMKKKFLNDPEKGDMYKKLWNEHGLKEKCEANPTLLSKDDLFLGAAEIAKERWQLEVQKKEGNKNQGTQEPTTPIQPASQTSNQTPTGLSGNDDDDEQVNFLTDTRSTEELGKYLRKQGVKITDGEIGLFRAAHGWRKPKFKRRRG